MQTDIAKYSIELFKPGGEGNEEASIVKTIGLSPDRSTEPGSRVIPGD